MHLLFPDNVRSVCVMGQQFDRADDGVLRDLDAATAREIMAHDPRFVPFDPSTIEDRNQRELEDKAMRREARVKMINGMERNALFAEGRAQGLAFPASFSNEKMRSLLISKIDALPVSDEQLMTDEQREIAMRATTDEARANVGGLVSGASTADAERDRLAASQHRPAENLPPAPAGAGPIVPGGTVNPPRDDDAGGDPDAIRRAAEIDPLDGRDLTGVGDQSLNDDPKSGESDGRGGHLHVDETKGEVDNATKPKPGESDGKGGHFNTE